MRVIALMTVLTLATLSPSADAAPLKLVIHEESGAEGDALPPASKYSALKRSLETALGRPVDIALTRDRQRVYDWMEHNQGDVFMTNAADQFFDGVKFDPANPQGYLDSLKIKKVVGA